MESSIAAFLIWWSSCELLPPSAGHRDPANELLMCWNCCDHGSTNSPLRAGHRRLNFRSGLLRVDWQMASWLCGAQTIVLAWTMLVARVQSHPILDPHFMAGTWSQIDRMITDVSPFPAISTGYGREEIPHRTLIRSRKEGLQHVRKFHQCDRLVKNFCVQAEDGHAHRAELWRPMSGCHCLSGV